MRNEKLTKEVPTDKFPGKNPLYDCLMSALDDLEKVTERHIKKEDDGVDFKVAQLQEVIQQKELLIKNKDELLGLRKEALLAAKDLLAQKDKIIRVCHPKEQPLYQRYLA